MVHCVTKSFFSSVLLLFLSTIFSLSLSFPSCMQFGILVGFGLGPLLVHSELTPQVCGNDTTKTTDPESYPFFGQWEDDIYSGLFYFLLGQAVFSVVFIAVTFIGELQ